MVAFPPHREHRRWRMDFGGYDGVITFIISKQKPEISQNNSSTFLFD